MGKNWPKFRKTYQISQKMVEIGLNHPAALTDKRVGTRLSQPIRGSGRGSGIQGGSEWTTFDTWNRCPNCRQNRFPTRRNRQKPQQQPPPRSSKQGLTGRNRTTKTRQPRTTLRTRSSKTEAGLGGITISAKTISEPPSATEFRMANPGGGTPDTPRALNDFDAGTVSPPTRCWAHDPLEASTRHLIRATTQRTIHAQDKGTEEKANGKRRHDRKTAATTS